MSFATIAAASRKRCTPVTAYDLTILSPAEHEEVTADFTMAWKDNTTQVEITNITEGQEVQPDFTMNFKTIL